MSVFEHKEHKIRGLIRQISQDHAQFEKSERLSTRFVKVIVKIIILLGLLAPAPVCSARPVPLDGLWRFAFDRTDSGEKAMSCSIKIALLDQAAWHSSSKTLWCGTRSRPDTPG